MRKRLPRTDMPMEEILKEVAKDNGFEYIPPEKRTPKKLVYSKSITGKTLVSLVDAEPKKAGGRKVMKRKSLKKLLAKAKRARYI